MYLGRVTVPEGLGVQQAKLDAFQKILAFDNIL